MTVRIALIKTSSMGDVIHALPVVTDILNAHPKASIDWVVESAFADLPRLSPGVGRVIEVALRRWRKTPFSASVWREIASARRALAKTPYDCVLDLQGLIKSAILARAMRGPHAGFSWACAREPLATLAYDQRYAVRMDVHAIERLRALAARALGYSVQGGPVFGLSAPGAGLQCAPPDGYAVLLHASSRASKAWPLENWRMLASALAERGVDTLLPWGSPAELQQAQAIAQAAPAGPGRVGARVLPALSLAQCAVLLRDAGCVVGVDTGLTHLACALDRPTVALFGATPAWRFGPYWSAKAVSLQSDAGRWPAPRQVLDALHTIAGLGDKHGQALPGLSAGEG
jgi:heptosyltransferase I